MAAVSLFSHILTTASSKSVVLVCNIGYLGSPFQMYYFRPSPTFTSTIFKDGGKTNDPISHELRQNMGMWTADFSVVKYFAFDLRFRHFIN